MESKVFNMQNKEVESITLKDEVFKVDYNEALVHEVVVAYLANQRQGTKSTLTRSEVRGHAKKPWKQKHTGSARHGSRKGPQWTGGGIVFAPKPRDFSKKVNKFAKRAAFLSAISQKVAQNELVILDEFKIEEAKTKYAQAFLNAFNFKSSTIVVLDEKCEDVLKASANIQKLDVTYVDLLNTYDVVSNKQVVITKSAIKRLEEAYE